MPSAIIAGATGAIGTALLEQLDSAGHYSAIHTLGRRAPAIDSARIHSHIVDYENLDSLVLPAGHWDVFCTLGTTIAQAGSKAAFRSVDFDYVVALGKLAARIDAHSMNVVSAIGANSQSMAFYSRIKGETEQTLIELPLRSLNIFRPSLLHGDRETFRLKEVASYYAISSVSPLLCGKLTKYRPVAIATVATAMRLVAQQASSGIRIIESDEIQQLGT
jgi:uncharacterized protein YbjT (DUF2867 family)